MPFITEELWQTLREQAGKSVVIALYPTAVAPSKEDEAFEGLMNDVISIITAIRTIRNELSISPALQLTAELKTATEKHAELLLREGEQIRRMARLSAFMPGPTALGGPNSVSGITTAGPIFVDLEGVDIETLEKERVRLEKTSAAVQGELARIEDKLKKPDFATKAPPDVVADHKRRLNELGQQLFTLSQRRRSIEDVLKGRSK
jgi:valyl-tRNA synthetase